MTLHVKPTLVITIFTLLASMSFADDIGLTKRGHVGCLKNPKKVSRLQITKPGVYENYLIDSNWATGNRVKITANNVTLRNCEIRNAAGNGVGVFANNVTIENCLIHHMLAGSFKNQKDAHGITGRWGNVTIRNCDIRYVSGDCIQFDPDRKSTGKVTIENCHLWTGPMRMGANGFNKGERPGENAIDTKTMPKGPRCKLIVRNCRIEGWKQPGQISNMAALNIKENVDADITSCVLQDNEICFRLRGPTKRGGAEVSISKCAIYHSDVGIRMEDGLRNLKVNQFGIGPGVKRKMHKVGRGSFPGYEYTGEYQAPPLK